MPNQGNKSKEKTGIVQKKEKPTMPTTEKEKKGNAAKHGGEGNTQKGDAESSAKK